MKHKPTPTCHYLVVYSLIKTNKKKHGDAVRLSDHWEVHETHLEAKASYDELMERDDLYVASICAPLESTDYDTVTL